MENGIVAAVFAVALLLPGAAIAQESGTTTAAQPATISATASAPSAATLEAEMMVCRTPRALIGTRFKGPRICKTQRQWDYEMQIAQHNLARGQIRGCDPNQGCNH